MCEKRTATRCLAILAVALAGGCQAVAAQGNAVRDYWHLDGAARLSFEGGGLSALAETPRGWLSLKTGGDEFLHTGKTFGGIVFRKTDGTYVTAFPRVSNMSHDALLGRNGQVYDGVYLTKLITGWTLPRFEIYAGFNDPRDHDLVLFLSDGVRAVRLMPARGQRYGGRLNIAAGDKGRDGPGCAIVHRSGRAVAIDHKVWAGTLPDPEGKPRLAVVVRCKGLAANTIPCIADAAPRTDSFLVHPRLAVRASNQQRCTGHWALYERDTDVEMDVTFGWLGEAPFQGTAELEVTHALGRRHVARSIRIGGQHRAEDGTYRVAFAPKFSLPGASEVFVRLVGADGSVLWAERFRMLYDWQHYRPTYLAPPDLKAFWDATLAELRRIPLEAKAKRVFADHPRWELYEVSLNGWKRQRIWAMLYVPKGAARPLPAVVTAHPGTKGWGIRKEAEGRYGSKIRADRRFVTLVPLIRGHKPDAPDIPFNHPWWGQLDRRDDYAARSWYCAMVRAVDYLASRPDLVDIHRVVARGGSQGGTLALATAALDPRIAACLADSPANCMLHEIIDGRAYDSFGPTEGQVPPGQTLDDAKRTLSTFDAAHLAPWITCPTVVGLTVGDLTVHCMGGLGVYHNLTALPPGKKWFLPGVNSNFHANSADGGRKMAEIMDRIAEAE